MNDVLREMTLDFFGKGQHKISPDRLLGLERAAFLDVRAHEEVETLGFGLKHHGNITVVHIPLDELPDRLAEIPRDKVVGVFCSGMVRSAIAYTFLRSKGFSNVRIVEGGYEAMTESLKPSKVLAVLGAKE